MNVLVLLLIFVVIDIVFGQLGGPCCPVETDCAGNVNDRFAKKTSAKYLAQSCDRDHALLLIRFSTVESIGPSLNAEGPGPSSSGPSCTGAHQAILQGEVVAHVRAVTNEECALPAIREGSSIEVQVQQLAGCGRRSDSLFRLADDQANGWVLDKHLATVGNQILAADNSRQVLPRTVLLGVRRRRDRNGRYEPISCLPPVLFPRNYFGGAFKDWSESLGPDWMAAVDSPVAAERLTQFYQLQAPVGPGSFTRELQERRTVLEADWAGETDQQKVLQQFDVRVAQMRRELMIGADLRGLVNLQNELHRLRPTIAAANTDGNLRQMWDALISYRSSVAFQTIDGWALPTGLGGCAAADFASHTHCWCPVGETRVQSSAPDCQMPSDAASRLYDPERTTSSYGPNLRQCCIQQSYVAFRFVPGGVSPPLTGPVDRFERARQMAGQEQEDQSADDVWLFGARRTISFELYPLNGDLDRLPRTLYVAVVQPIEVTVLDWLQADANEPTMRKPAHVLWWRKLTLDPAATVGPYGTVSIATSTAFGDRTDGWQVLARETDGVVDTSTSTTSTEADWVQAMGGGGGDDAGKYGFRVAVFEPRVFRENRRLIDLAHAKSHGGAFQLGFLGCQHRRLAFEQQLGVRATSAGLCMPRDLCRMSPVGRCNAAHTTDVADGAGASCPSLGLSAGEDVVCCDVNARSGMGRDPSQLYAVFGDDSYRSFWQNIKSEVAGLTGSRLLMSMGLSFIHPALNPPWYGERANARCPRSAAGDPAGLTQQQIQLYRDDATEIGQAVLEASVTGAGDQVNALDRPSLVAEIRLEPAPPTAPEPTELPQQLFTPAFQQNGDGADDQLPSGGRPAPFLSPAAALQGRQCVPVTCAMMRAGLMQIFVTDYALGGASLLQQIDRQQPDFFPALYLFHQDLAEAAADLPSIGQQRQKALDRVSFLLERGLVGCGRPRRPWH